MSRDKQGNRDKQGKATPVIVASKVPWHDPDVGQKIFAVTKIEEIDKETDNIMKDGVRVVAVSKEEALLYNKYCQQKPETLIEEERAQLKVLAAKLSGVKKGGRGRPLNEAHRDARAREVAWIYLCLRAAGHRKHRLTNKLAELFQCSKRTIEADIQHARNLDDGRWWLDHEHDPRLDAWRPPTLPVVSS